MKERLITLACCRNWGGHSQWEAFRPDLGRWKGLCWRIEEISVSLMKGQHEQRLGGEIYLQWVLTVCGIPASMEDKVGRSEGKDGETILGRQDEARSRRALWHSKSLRFQWLTIGKYFIIWNSANKIKDKGRHTKIWTHATLSKLTTKHTSLYSWHSAENIKNRDRLSCVSNVQQGLFSSIIYIC